MTSPTSNFKSPEKQETLVFCDVSDSLLTDDEHISPDALYRFDWGLGWFARKLRQNGYTPVPLKTGTKRPARDNWRTDAEAIAAETNWRDAGGLGIAGGYGGLRCRVCG